MIKKLSFALLLIGMAATGFAQKTTYQLSTHILDISVGLPAENVSIKLEKLNASDMQWQFISEKNTNKDGRINDFLPLENSNDGTYRLTFYVADYFKNKNIDTFYPFIEVVFKIEGKTHFHVPITLSAFGYSTYRGS